jgi:threonine-phosphate decarboxylase
VKDAYTTAGGLIMEKEKLIDVSAGICPLGPSRKVKAAVRKAVGKIGLPHAAAVRRLERSFSSRYGVPAERILFANSLRELSGLLLGAKKPKKVVIAGGLRGLYGEDASDTAMEVRYLTSGVGFPFGTDPEELVRAAGEADLVIVSNPDRVTGRLLDEAVFSGVCGLAEQGGLLVVVDESLMEFTGREGLDPVSSGKRNIVTLRTTANFYGLPGLELAYAVSVAETLGEMRERRYSMPNRLSVAAAKTAFRDTAYKREVARFLAEEKRFLSQEFGRTGRATFFDSDSNVYLLKFEGWGEGFSASLLRSGFLVREHCRLEGSDASLLRMSVLAHDKNVKLARLMRGLSSLPGFGSRDEKDRRGS